MTGVRCLQDRLTGVDQLQDEETCEVTLSQAEYSKAMKPIVFDTKNRQPDGALAAWEATECLRVQGEALWLVVNTHPELAAQVSLTAGLDGAQKIVSANKLVKAIHQNAGSKLGYVKPGDGSLRHLAIMGQCDMGFQTMPNNRGEGGELYFLVPARDTPFTCERTKANLTHWRCGRVRRVCRASLTEETLTATDTPDTLVYLINHYTEWASGKRPRRETPTDFSTLYVTPLETLRVRSFPTYLIADCRDLADHTCREASLR